MVAQVVALPMEARHITDAGRLLAARQARLRAERPELPARYEDPVEAARLLAGELERHAAHGVVVEQSGEPAGFLIGAPRIDQIMGRTAWAGIAGSSLASGVSPDLLGDLYAAWSPHWVTRGVLDHYVLVPAGLPAELAAWHALGFGIMQAHGLRATAADDLPAVSDGLHVRRAEVGDIDAIAHLGPLVAMHQAGPPTWAPVPPERIEEYPRLYAEELASAEAYLWVACDPDGRALGLAAFYEAEPGPMTPDGAWELGVAMTDPRERGRGVARSLLRVGLEAARDAGAGHCIIDWRTANLQAARTWPALGFRPTHLRLHRRLDERIAWAHG
jgi:GNAT superfamily N-acetyltransferase